MSIRSVSVVPLAVLTLTLAVAARPVAAAPQPAVPIPPAAFSFVPPETAAQFKASFNALPGRNFGTLAALILIAAPVRGLRPLRAERLPTANVPKPTNETDPPFLRVVLTAPTIESSARVAAALEISACFAMCSINSVLFTRSPSFV